MARLSTNVAKLHSIFVRLHRYQRKGADNLVALISRYLRARADYTSAYIDLVSERSGVSPTGRITTTNADVMIAVVREMFIIDNGIEPSATELHEAWDMFIKEYQANKFIR